MSVDHSYQIGLDERCTLWLNISGVNSGGEDIASLSACIYAFDNVSGSPKFTCALSFDDLRNLYSHLGKYGAIQSESVAQNGKFIEVSGNTEQILTALTAANSESLIPALSSFIRHQLSSDDMNTILGRKESLLEFNQLLDRGDAISEPDWQRFFERNEWIFGYGLKYRYLKILQREARVSPSDTDGSNEVIVDFLMSDLKFTKLIELKKPTTPLFKERRNRSDSWCLSGDLSDAVSQILSQKANWDIHSGATHFTDSGAKIHEATHDVECVLIIGMKSAITGTDREKEMKIKTIELYRRNLKNIDIVFYDELLERAEYIVHNSIRT